MGVRRTNFVSYGFGGLLRALYKIRLPLVCPCHCGAKMSSHAGHHQISDCQKGADPSCWLGKGKWKYSKIQGNTGFALVLDKVIIVPNAEEQRRRNINQISVEFRVLLFTPRVQNASSVLIQCAFVRTTRVKNKHGFLVGRGWGMSHVELGCLWDARMACLVGSWWLHVA